jgi:3-phytase/alkaline phosphatase D
MLVLSHYPISSSRTFKNFKWKDMPDALIPLNEDGSAWYPEIISNQLRLSSKSHWDVELATPLGPIHFLASHPTPPVFDGPEDRNGTRNHDEIRFWADYITPQKSHYIYDDRSRSGGLPVTSQFVIAGDQNADPFDGDSQAQAIDQLLENPLVNTACTPSSEGAVQATAEQQGKNLEHKGEPGFDTADFNDEYTGNMRVDYVLPSKNLQVADCGVFWPETDSPSSDWIKVSDHRLVWVSVTQ